MRTGINDFTQRHRLQGWTIVLPALALMLLAFAGQLADGTLTITTDPEVLAELTLSDFKTFTRLIAGALMMIMVWRFLDLELLKRCRYVIWGLAFLSLGVFLVMGNRYDYDVYLPSIMYALLPFVSFVVLLAIHLLLEGFKNEGGGFFAFIVIVILAVIASTYYYLPFFYTAVMGLGALAMCTNIALEKHLPSLPASKRPSLVFIVIGVAIMVFLGAKLTVVSNGAAHLEAFLSQGASHPYTEGWQYMKIESLLSSARFFGATDSVFEPLTMDVFAWNNYPLVRFILAFGKLPGILIVVTIALLIVLIIKSHTPTGTGTDTLGIGLAVVVIAPSVLGVLINLNLFPITGMSIPFLTVTNYSTYMFCLVIGLMAAVRRKHSRPLSPKALDALVRKMETGTSLFTPSNVSLFDEKDREYLPGGSFDYSFSDKTKLQTPPKVNPNAEAELEALVGLDEAKLILEKVIALARFNSLYPKPQSDKQHLHMFFAGKSGLGKTTAARLIAQVLYNNKVIRNPEIVEVGRGDLVGKFVGATAPKVTKVFTRATGGVLFIDEAYSLLDSGRGDYGDEALTTIVQEMERREGDPIVIFAGYPAEMEALLHHNPGLKSRIRFVLNFPDYTVSELLRIADHCALQYGYTLADGVHEKLKPLIREAMGQKGFGNGRWIRNMIEQAELNLAFRTISSGAEISSDARSILLPEDFEDLSSNIIVQHSQTIGFTRIQKEA